MFANNKENLNPADYPNLIKTDLIELKDIAINLYFKDPGEDYMHYTKLIFLESSIVLIGLIVIIFNSIYIIPQI